MILLFCSPLIQHDPDISAIKDWFQSVNSEQHVIEYVQKDLMELFENLHSGTPSNAKQLHHFVKSHDVIVGGAKNHSRDR